MFVIKDLDNINSIINNNFEAKDSERAFTFIEFIKEYGYNNSQESFISIYKSYLVRYAEAKNKNIENSTEEYVRNKMVELLKSITLTYSSYEEQNYVANLDWNDTEQVKTLIPYYSKKIQEICDFYRKKRNDIAFIVSKHASRGSKKSIEEIIYDKVFDFIFDNKNNILQMGELKRDLSVSIENYVDVYSEYFDIPRDEEIIDKERGEYLYANENDVDYKDYLEISKVIADTLYSGKVYLKEIPLIANLALDLSQDCVGELYDLKERLLAKVEINRIPIDEQIALRRKLYEKFLGCDLYYLYSDSNKQTNYGLLTKANNPSGNLLNCATADKAVTPANEYELLSHIGLFFKPDKLSFLKINSKNYSWEIDESKLEPSTMYVFPNPNFYGDIGNNKTADYPIMMIHNLDYDIKNFSMGEARNQPLLLISDSGWSSYYSKQQQDFKLVDNKTFDYSFSSLANKGHLFSYTTDVYGNEFGIFKGYEEEIIEIPNPDGEGIITKIQITITSREDKKFEYNTEDTTIKAACIQLNGGYFRNPEKKSEAFNYDVYNYFDETYIWSGIRMKEKGFNVFVGDCPLIKCGEFTFEQEGEFIDHYDYNKSSSMGFENENIDNISVKDFFTYIFDESGENYGYDSSDVEIIINHKNNFFEISNSTGQLYVRNLSNGKISKAKNVFEWVKDNFNKVIDFCLVDETFVVETDEKYILFKYKIDGGCFKNAFDFIDKIEIPKKSDWIGTKPLYVESENSFYFFFLEKNNGYFVPFIFRFNVDNFELVEWVNGYDYYLLDRKLFFNQNSKILSFDNYESVLEERKELSVVSGNDLFKKESKYNLDNFLIKDNIDYSLNGVVFSYNGNLKKFVFCYILSDENNLYLYEHKFKLSSELDFATSLKTNVYMKGVYVPPSENPDEPDEPDESSISFISLSDDGVLTARILSGWDGINPDGTVATNDPTNTNGKLFNLIDKKSVISIGDVFDISGVTNCSYMFSNCSSLTDLSNDFTIPDNVTNCSSMFYGCSSLTHLPDNFIIPNGVKICSSMFYGCSSLTHLSDNFMIPDGVTNCSNVFNDCSSLISLSDNFIIPNGVKICSSMFYGCSSLTHLPDNFMIPDSVTNCSTMFGGCSSLTHLPDNFTIPKDVTNPSYMFNRCSSLTHLPDNFTIPDGTTSCSYMFSNCSSLTHLPDNFTIPNSVTECSFMFNNCSSLISTNEKFAFTNNATIYYSFISRCYNLSTINVILETQKAVDDFLGRIDANTGKNDSTKRLNITFGDGLSVSNIDSTVYENLINWGWIITVVNSDEDASFINLSDDGVLTARILSGWDGINPDGTVATNDPTNTNGKLFNLIDKKSVISIGDVFDISGVTNCSYMFNGCSSLTHIPDNFTIPDGVTNCFYMFNSCTSLTSLPNNFVIPNGVIDCSFIFTKCTSLASLPDNFTIPDSVTNCSNMFGGCSSLTHLPDNFTIPDNVTDCSNMFNDCSSLISLPDNFTIPDSVTNCSNMFETCFGLTSLPNNFVIPNSVTNCSHMFTSCTSLTHLPDNFTIPDSVTNCSYMFSGITIVEINNFNIFCNYPKGLFDLSSSLSSIKNLVLGDDITLKKNSSVSQMIKWCSNLSYISIVTNSKSVAEDFMDEIIETNPGPENIDKQLIIIYSGSEELSQEKINTLISMRWLTLVSSDDYFIEVDENGLLSCNIPSDASLWINYSSYTDDPRNENGNLFNNYKSQIVGIDADNFNIDNVVSCKNMFSGCTNLTSVDGFYFPSSVTDCSGLFNGCSNLALEEEFTISEGVEDCSYMFNNCGALNKYTDNYTPTINFEDIHLPSTLKNANYMFCGCTMYRVTVENKPPFVLPDSIETCNGMFMGSNIPNKNVSGSNGYLNIYKLPQNCTSANSMFSIMSNYDTTDGLVIHSGVKNILSLFNKSIPLVNVKNLLIEDGVENGKGLFDKCYELVNIINLTLPNSITIKTNRLGSSIGTFRECEKLKYISVNVYSKRVAEELMNEIIYHNAGSSASDKEMVINYYCDDDLDQTIIDTLNENGWSVSILPYGVE